MMKLTSNIAVTIGVSLFLLLMTESNAAGQGFSEQFSSSTLDPAWQVVPYSGTVPRAHGFGLPANDFSLSANPGHLRYTLNHMTHHDGYLNSYQTTFSFHSCCNHDAGLELHRTFGGEDWLFEAKASYFMPFANGRALVIRVYFGDGGANTMYAEFGRHRDGPFPFGTPETVPVDVRLVKKLGPNLADAYQPGSYLEYVPVAPNPAGDTYYYRLLRAGSTLTAMWSYDGVSWNTAFVRDMGAEIAGLAQRVVIAGLSWFVPAGSFADYDYISVTPTNQPPVAVCQNVTAPAGPDCAASVSIDNGSFDPDGDPLSLSQSPAGPYPLGSTLVTLTVTDSKGASSQCQATVTVVDGTPPTISGASVNPSVLWPPNHKMVDVIVNYNATDNCGVVNCSLSVSSNEPVDGTGDGDTAPDWEVIDAHHVRLRAERAGTGNGRVYTITIACSDGAGNSSVQTITVTVPKNQK